MASLKLATRLQQGKHVHTCVCVYIYIYIHIYIYIYIYVYIYIYTHIYIHLHILNPRLMCVCIYIYVYIYVCVYARPSYTLRPKSPAHTVERTAGRTRTAQPTTKPSDIAWHVALGFRVMLCWVGCDFRA